MTAEEKIIEVLGVADGHVSSLELQSATGLCDRAVRTIIEDLRYDGVCILSDSKGYFLPNTEDEIREFIKRTEKTAMSYFRSLRTAKKALRNFNAQQLEF